MDRSRLSIAVQRNHSHISQILRVLTQKASSWSTSSRQLMGARIHLGLQSLDLGLDLVQWPWDTSAPHTSSASLCKKLWWTRWALSAVCNAPNDINSGSLFDSHIIVVPVLHTFWLVKGGRACVCPIDVVLPVYVFLLRLLTFLPDLPIGKRKHRGNYILAVGI